jgi:hypothetical protein
MSGNLPHIEIGRSILYMQLMHGGFENLMANLASGLYPTLSPSGGIPQHCQKAKALLARRTYASRIFMHLIFALGLHDA